MTMTTEAPPRPRQLVNGGDPDAPYFLPLDELFNGAYFAASDLDGMATALLEAYELDLQPHRTFDVAYLWKQKGGTRDGKAVLGKCVLVRGLLAHFCPARFIIWLAADHLRDAKASRYLVEAILYHEMLHVGEDEDGEPVLIPHEFTGFAAELRRYGAYTHDLRVAHQAFEQMPLFELDPLTAARELRVELDNLTPDA